MLSRDSPVPACGLDARPEVFERKKGSGRRWGTGNAANHRLTAIPPPEASHWLERWEALGSRFNLAALPGQWGQMRGLIARPAHRPTERLLELLARLGQ